MGPGGPGDMGPGGPGDMGPGGPGGPGGSGGSGNTESTMVVTLDQARLEGAISSAELTLAIPDGAISFDNIRDVGVVAQTTLTYNPFARLHVSLINGSSWTVTKSCHLMELDLAQGTELIPPAGFGLRMTVDGVETPLEPGRYVGQILLEVFSEDNAGTPEADASSGPLPGNPPPSAPMAGNPAPVPGPASGSAPGSAAPAGGPAGPATGSNSVVLTLFLICLLGLCAVLALELGKRKR